MTVRNLSFLSELILFSLILFFAVRPIENYDFWFHAKYGEFIVQTHTLPFVDYFSHTAYGQPAVPYEWLFQLFIYLVYQRFGSVGVQSAVVFFTLAYTLLFRRILKEIFAVPLLPRLTLIGSLFLISYDYFVERPQIVAYTLFLATLYLVLKYTFQNKNLLFLTVPIFLLWTNLHASIVLGLYLLFSFGTFFLVRFWYSHQRNDLQAAKDLLVFGAVNAAITVLPPLGTKVYQLLYLFFLKRDFIAQAIDEWVPLPRLAERFYLYLAIMVLDTAAFLWATSKPRRLASHYLLLFLPLIPLGLFVLSGVRQTPFSLPILFILLIPAISLIKMHASRAVSLISALLILAGTAFGSHLYATQERKTAPVYPSNASLTFAKQNLQGNMFNEYHLGGFLMYRLGPEIKTFIDGRADMFLPEVLPEYSHFSSRTNLDDKNYLTEFNVLVTKYHISWAFLSTNRYTLSWRLGRIFGDDTRWHLVFFDDQARIYIRDDGKNDQTIKQYSITAATPFAKKLYREGAKDKAREEYQRMEQISPSAVSLNALGYFLLEDRQFDQARDYLNQALKINPHAAAPKMNLAELSAKDGDLETAIKLYRQAVSDDPERGLAYLRLGQLLGKVGKTDEARQVWGQGLTVTPDEEILQKLRQELNK